ncbi:pectate lyase-like adhesive domain-containing protein, partial [Methanobrevibacter sp.]
MKLSKTLKILSIILLLALLMGIVSANDNGSNDYDDALSISESQDLNLTNGLSPDGEATALGQSNNQKLQLSDENKLTASDEDAVGLGQVKSFTDLQNLIESSYNDGVSVIALENDYKFTPGPDDGLIGGITIPEGLKIIGNGSTIDGGNAARIFKVDSSANVGGLTLSNMTLVNGSSDYGGAILFNGNGLLTLEDVVMKYNAATYMGGAVFVNSSSQGLTVEKGR